jgi:glycosyltransferase involved in cell wall biosynthesis
LNKGIELATGDVVGILHADDLYASSDVLERVAEVFANKEIDSCYGDLVYFKEVDRLKAQDSRLKVKNKEPNNAEDLKERDFVGKEGTLFNC